MANGHSSAKCPHVFCQAHDHHADKGVYVRGSQRQGLSAVPARLAAALLRPSVAHPSDDCHLRGPSASLF